MNSLGLDLEKNTVVVLARNVMDERYQALRERTVKIEGGFGASARTRGTALAVTFFADMVEGNDDEIHRFEGYQISREETFKLWAWLEQNEAAVDLILAGEKLPVKRGKFKQAYNRTYDKAVIEKKSPEYAVIA